MKVEGHFYKEKYDLDANALYNHRWTNAIYNTSKGFKKYQFYLQEMEGLNVNQRKTT